MLQNSPDISPKLCKALQKKVANVDFGSVKEHVNLVALEAGRKTWL